jgi:hypothetical protein
LGRIQCNADAISTAETTNKGQHVQMTCDPM